MNPEIVITCPICGNENFELYLKAKDHTVTEEEFEIKKCTTCHFLITSPRPSEFSITKYYTSHNYISHSGKSNNLFDKIYLAARSITLKWKTDLINQFISKPATLLDYGCGTGEFLSHIQKNGYKIIGVEPNQSAREKANQKLQGKVSANLNLIHHNSVDIITLWHVLEHVHNLNETLDKLKNLLTEKGLILIAVPNPDSHDSKKYKNNWAGFDVPRHLWHFTQETMSKLLHKNGLKLVAIRPMKLDSYYVSLLSEQYQNPKQQKIITAIKAFKEGLTSNITAKKNKAYSSLIYISRPE